MFRKLKNVCNQMKTKIIIFGIFLLPLMSLCAMLNFVAKDQWMIQGSIICSGGSDNRFQTA